MTKKTRIGLAVGGAVLMTAGITGSAPAAASIAPTAPAAPSVATVTKLSHADATARFSRAGITWSSSGNCSDRNNPRCTSFSQINLDTVNGAITLKRASGCAVHITGGTETGHAPGTYSHWNGYKLDFRPNWCLSGYIIRTFRYIGQRDDGAALFRSAAGNIYARESNHWDVLYYNCGGC